MISHDTTQVRVSHEERDVWMLFLEKAVAGEEGYFDSAVQHCKSAVERAQVGEAAVAAAAAAGTESGGARKTERGGGGKAGGTQ